MPTDSILELLAALSSGDFERLVGMREGHEVDFKKEPYRLDTAKGKWELAKDVAAFANAGGGCIVIGARTEQHECEAVEAVVKVSPIPKEQVSVARYRDTLADRLIPSPKALEVRWYPDDPSVPRGLLLLRVPAAAELDKPVVMRRTVDPDGEQVAAFAIPVRNQDRTEWEPVERVQQLLSSARFAQRAALDSAWRASAQERKATAEVRAQDLRRLGGWTDDPCVILQAVAPVAASRVATTPRARGPPSVRAASPRRHRPERILRSCRLTTPGPFEAPSPSFLE